MFKSAIVFLPPVFPTKPLKSIIENQDEEIPTQHYSLPHPLLWADGTKKRAPLFQNVRNLGSIYLVKNYLKETGSNFKAQCLLPQVSKLTAHRMT